MNPPRIIDAVVLTFIFFLYAATIFATLTLFNGCSSKHDGLIVDTLMYDHRPAINAIIIEKSPIRVQYYGDVTPMSVEFTKDLVKSVSIIPYKNYKFNTTVMVNASVSGKVKDTQCDSTTFNSRRKRK